MRPYFPGGILNALACDIHLKRQTSSIHRLRLGLLGSLIQFAPLAFVHQRQFSTSSLLTPLVFLAISTHFTAPLQVPATSESLKDAGIKTVPPVKREYFSFDLAFRLRNPLRPVNPDNACTLRITAAAGTYLASAYSLPLLYPKHNF